MKVSSAIIVTVNDLLSHREKKTSPGYKTLIPRLILLPEILRTFF